MFLNYYQAPCWSLTLGLPPHDAPYDGHTHPLDGGTGLSPELSVATQDSDSLGQECSRVSPLEGC